MTENTTNPTARTGSKTITRRRALGAATSALALTTVAGCQTNNNTDGTTTAQEVGHSGSLPHPFESVHIGKYAMTVQVQSPDDLQSVALTKPPDGVVETNQASGEVEFTLMDDAPYSPGEFVLEARQDDAVVAEYPFEMRPEPHITKVELLKNQERDALTSIQERSNDCASLPSENIYTVENRGSGPAALEQLMAPFPESVEGDRSPRDFDCHAPPHTIDYDDHPALAPGEKLDFSPTFGSTVRGYRSQEVGATYDATLKVKEGVSGDVFQQPVEMRFVDKGEGNRMPTYDISNDDVE